MRFRARYFDQLEANIYSLIIGDHPQCYVNDIFVFGHQRDIANQWLAVLGMQDRSDQPFNNQSYGD